MWLVTTLPLLVALAAAPLAWRHATRIDRASPGEARCCDRRSWRIAVGALVAAVAAISMLQSIVLWHP
jgi:hypothetical protein